ncbi:type IV-A pilus assembly ATPase PilB [bacterium]|nr:type IV-A pilus assembly ATPase PilB [bacterium]
MRLGEMLIKASLITEEQLNEALQQQKKEGGKIGSSLVKLNFITEEKILEVLQQQLGVVAIDLDNFEIDDETLSLIPPDVAKKHLVVPIEKLGDTLTVAMSEVDNKQLMADLQFITNLNISPAVATERSIKDAIDRYYKGAMEKIQERTADIQDTVMDFISSSDEEEAGLSEEEISGDEKPLVKLVNQIIMNGITKGASDIHIEPFEKYVRLRYRVDGVLHKDDDLPKAVAGGIASRIKIMAHLDVAEKRVPQDGKAQVRYGGRKIDLRTATVPCVHGEKIVIRILDKGGGEVTLEMLGFEPEQLKRFTKSIQSPWGMILITGPTGSGKTWTLSTSLKLLNTEDVNIMTAEDPVEFDIEGLNQVQARPEIGYTFAAALKSFLRADPDIVMIGEIRDFETGDIAIKAAQTGHLVFATLHTNSAPDTIARLSNMGIEPFNTASSLIMVIAQRLVRKVCQHCKVEEDVSNELKIQMGIPKEKLNEVKFYKGKGCSKCNGSGYKGRTAIYEVLFISEALRDLIVKKAPIDQIRLVARKEGMTTLRESGVLKALAGITTVEEVFKNTAADEEIE